MSFDRRNFDAACADLMRRVVRDGRPDLIVGIPTGGLHVAESMARSAGGAIPVLALTCRRPSTRLKRATAPLRQLLAQLPSPVQDRLRLLEHRMLTRQPARTPQTPYRFDRDELAVFDAGIARAGGHPDLLIVDDAVDSGATLAQVLDAVGRRAAGAQIRCAVITVTTDAPLVRPDYVLYRQQLCRFPWSLDVKKRRLSSS